MKLPRLHRPSRRSRSLALALGLALASGVALAAWAATDGAPSTQAPPLAGMMLPRGPLLDRLLDDVQASASQRAQAHQILEAAEADLHKQRDIDRAGGRRMAALFMEPVVDPVAVEAVRLRIEAQHDAVSRRTTQALIDLGQVFNVEQRRQIALHLADGSPPFGVLHRSQSAAGAKD